MTASDSAPTDTPDPYVDADVMIHLDPVSMAEEQLDDRIEAVEQSEGP